MLFTLDHSLILDDPHEVWLGELPRRFRDVPAPVVVNLCGDFPAGNPQGRVVFAMPFLDVLDVEAVPERGELEAFVDAIHPYALRRATYWHCHAGINRSSMVLSIYLHRHRGMRISDAIALLRTQRSEMVLCNTLFEQKLRAWYGESDEQTVRNVTLETYLRQRMRKRERDQDS